MKKQLEAVLAGAALCILGAPTAQALVIDTTPGNSTFQSFGETNTATYGQTFTTPIGENSLDSFTFYLNDNVNPDFVDFEAYVYAWDSGNFRATGSALFSSGPYSTTGAAGFEAFTINTGGVSLAPGAQYVAFFTASNLFDGANGTAAWSSRPDNPYTGGEFVFLNNGSNFAALTSTTWTGDWQSVDSDLAFRMEFGLGAQVPEPSILALLGASMAAFGFAGRRRKR